MKKYKMSFADAMTHIPAHPERTARREGVGMDFDVTFQEWPSRASMMKTIEMQERSGSNYMKWRAVRLPNPRRRNPVHVFHVYALGGMGTGRDYGRTYLGGARSLKPLEKLTDHEVWKIGDAFFQQNYGGVLPGVERRGRFITRYFHHNKHSGNIGWIEENVETRENPSTERTGYARLQPTGTISIAGLPLQRYELSLEVSGKVRELWIGDSMATQAQYWHGTWKILTPKGKTAAIKLLKEFAPEDARARINPGYTSADLRRGARVEMEHAHLFPRGKRAVMARKIARDHLREGSTYYRRLAKMERDMKVRRKNPSGVAVKTIRADGLSRVLVKLDGGAWTPVFHTKDHAEALKMARVYMNMHLKARRK